MTQNLKLGNIDTTQKVSVSNQINSNLQYTNIKSDSFTVDMDPFDTIPNSRITRNHSRKGSRGDEKKMHSSGENERDGSSLVPNSSSPRATLVGTAGFDTIPNSRITLQRNHSRKGTQRGGEKKMDSSGDNGRDGSILVPNSSSQRGALVGSSTLEKPIVVTVGATTYHPINHQITITTPATTAAAPTTITTESKLWGKRYSFKRSSSFWTIGPRRIVFFFATLSSMGTILLIYFTLSLGK